MLALRWDTSTSGCQLAQGDDGALVTDEGLESLCMILLFTDRRASPAEVERFRLADPRGWWAESLREEGEEELGSRLWLLHRDKLTPDALVRARGYVEEALGHLVRVGIAAAVQVAVAPLKGGGALGIDVVIHRPPLDRRSPFRAFWEYTVNAIR